MNASRTVWKSLPFGSPLLNAPGTFSHTPILGRTSRADLPRFLSASLISVIIRICSQNKPERAPSRPFLAPAIDTSWHGLPPQMMSTGGSSAPSSLVMSPTWIMSGKRSLVTRMGNVSISLAHTGVIPLRTAARGKPPIPSNRLPMVSVFFSVIYPSPPTR